MRQRGRWWPAKFASTAVALRSDASGGGDEDWVKRGIVVGSRGKRGGGVLRPGGGDRREGGGRRRRRCVVLSVFLSASVTCCEVRRVGHRAVTASLRHEHVRYIYFGSEASFIG